MTRLSLVSGLAVLVLGALALGCKAGGVGDPCIPNLEYSASVPGFVETEPLIEDRSFQCETRVCLVNHFQGRVTCPLGNADCTKADDCKVSSGGEKRCFVPGTNQEVKALVKPQCSFRRDSVYCSCRCGGTDSAAKYCECPEGYDCEEVGGSLDPNLVRPGDKYCVKRGNKWVGESCTFSSWCDRDDDPCQLQKSGQQ